MKIYLIIIIYLLTGNLAIAREGFTVTVKLAHFAGDQVRMSYIDSNKYIVINAVPENGNWVFKGRVSEPTVAKLSFLTAGKDLRFNVLLAAGTAFISPTDDGFILSNSELLVEGDGKYSWDYTINGDTANNEWAPVKKRLATLRQITWTKIKELHAAFEISRDSSLLAAMKRERQLESTKLDSVKKAFITTHPGSYMSVALLSSLMNQMELNELSAYYSPLSETWKSTFPGKLLVSAVEGGKATQAGKMAPDFTRTDIKGTEFTLSELKGKYVLLDFWGSWCGPCRKSHPHLRQLYDQYRGADFEIVGIAEEMSSDIEKSRQAWKKAVEEDSIGWIQVLNHDLNAKLNENIVAAYGITGFPTKILLNREGVILNRDLDNRQLERMLKEIFDHSFH